MGNAAYPDGKSLANPTNDATDIAAKLRGYGFNVIIATDCNARQMDEQLEAFESLLKAHDVGMFFFAGHGIQIGGSNYLLAIDANEGSEASVKRHSLSLDSVVDVMADSDALTKIIVLDACRNNPWERNWNRGSTARGLASVYAPKGTIIGFATSPGEVAGDGIGRNGTYTEALLQHIDTPDISIEMMFKRVRNHVAATTGGKQTSWEHTSLSGEFYFNLSVGKLVEEYDGTALADKLFVPDSANGSYLIITGLKTYNWDSQNAALDKLTAAAASKMMKSDLFVVGRNIYQAACGSSNCAIAFIKNFMRITSGYELEKRKAILDGMLFEVFFNSSGELRAKIKERMFNEVFELEQHKDLKLSFEFISETLLAVHADFYVLPGKGHELVVSVSIKKRQSGLFVDAIYVDGINVLVAGEDIGDAGNDKIAYIYTKAEVLNRELSEKLVVPSRLLKITYTMAEAQNSDELRIRRGWTVRKPKAGA